MSYLLDALRKSERERQLGEVPMLSVAVADRATPRQRRLPWLMMILLLLNAAFLFYLWHWTRNTEAQPPPAAKTAQSQRPAIAPKQENLADKLATPLRKMDETATGKNSAERAIAPQKLSSERPRPTKAAPPSQANAAPQSASPKESKAPLAALDVERPPGREKAAQAATKPSPPMRAEQTKTDRNTSRSQPARPLQAQISSETGRTERSAPPLLMELPSEFRRRIPSLKVNVYAYSDNPAERFVIIDMIKYRSGQRIAEGPLLEEINADSLTLNFEGKKFRLPRP